MIRTASLSAAVLVCVCLVPSTAAVAAGETCRGEAATVVGAGFQPLTGTEGRDVIVTNGVATVLAFGGDDLICVTGAGAPHVDAGAGNDLVDATAGTATPYTVLGEGDDRYVGSALPDDVVAGSDETTDTGVDVIDTGVNAGTTPDEVTSGTRGQVNADRTTGGAMTLFWLGRPTAGSAAQAGGLGSSFQILHPNDMSRLEIDTRAGTLAIGTGTDTEAALALSGFTAFSVRSDRLLERFTFRGSDVAESVTLWNSGAQTRTRVALGRGDDLLAVGRFGEGSRLSGGFGVDRLVTGSTKAVDLDLRAARLVSHAGVRRTSARAAGFERADVAAPRVALIGTQGPNEIDVDACRATVRGLGGRDRITAARPSVDGARIRCANGRRFRLFGDAGNDKLVGGPGADLLVGGPGLDRAEGRTGRDTCVAEVRRECDVRR